MTDQHYQIPQPGDEPSTGLVELLDTLAGVGVESEGDDSGLRIIVERASLDLRPGDTLSVHWGSAELRLSCGRASIRTAH